MLEAAAHGLALEAQDIFTSKPGDDLHHRLLKIHYDRVEDEARKLRSCAATLRQREGRGKE